MWLSLSADASWATLDRYRLKLTVEYETTWAGGVYSEITKLTEFPDESGEVHFNVQRAIEGILKHSLPTWPASNVATKDTTGIRLVRLTIEELYGSTSTPQSTQVLTPFSVIRAGFNRWTDQGLSTYITSRLFLTMQPQEKLAHSLQPEWLSIIVDSTNTWTLYVKYTYEDDTQSADIATAITLSATDGDLTVWPSGYTQLGLDTVSPKIVEWEVWISDGTNQSEHRSYVLDESPDYLSRFYLWEGSLGGWHTMTTRGEGSWESSVSSVSVQKSLRHNASPQEFPIGWTATVYQNTHEQYSGYIPLDHAEWIGLDLMISEHVFRIGEFAPNRTATGDLIPIRIERDTVTVRKDNRFLGVIVFSYIESANHTGL